MFKLALGEDDFYRLRSSGAYFIDKSRFIGEFWRDDAKVLLLPRPRRFGKSLNLSMLRYFFSVQEKGRDWFSGLAIEQDDELMAEQGKYPVIHLNLKSIKGESFDECMQALAGSMANLVANLKSWLIEEAINPAQRTSLEQLGSGEPEQVNLQCSLFMLSALLSQSLGQRVIILIDEYDAPLLEFYSSKEKEYRRMVNFYRGFLGAALKDNPYLHKGCLTGILRIARESIFSDLNNIMVCSLLSRKFNTSFGFTTDEVTKLLADFDLSARFPEVRQWYNGYDFGGEVIYNPWSVLGFTYHRAEVARPYWINSSENQIIKNLVITNGSAMREELAQLIMGESIEAPLNEHINLSEVSESRAHIWNFLTFTGYLKPVAYRQEGRSLLYRLKIPNDEVRAFYEDHLYNWLQANLAGDTPLQPLFNALQDADWQSFEQHLNRILSTNTSYHDTAHGENFYHALFIGMLLHLPGYKLQSNRESGQGRYDCQLNPQDKNQPGFIFEFKQVDAGSDFSKTLSAAQRQIQRLEYANDLQSAGINPIHAIAVATDGKQARLRTRKIA